jgi:hypothetical protein
MDNYGKFSYDKRFVSDNLMVLGANKNKFSVHAIIVGTIT